jgi:hypothetical protein
MRKDDLEFLKGTPFLPLGLNSYKELAHKEKVGITNGS